MRRPLEKTFGCLSAAVALAALLACSGEDALSPGATVELSFEGVDRLEEGGYRAWVVGGAGDTSLLGTFRGGPEAGLEAELPVDDPTEILVDVRPPNGGESGPGPYLLMGGPVEGSTAELSIHGYLTTGRQIGLEEDPGTHVLFTPSDNSFRGYPSYEDGGIWVFNIAAQGKPKNDEDICRDYNDENDFFLDFAPLSEGWSYEGWAVRDHGTGASVWLSYGRFAVNEYGKADNRDNTGLGPLSGKEDFDDGPLARAHCFPGDDWVMNPYGVDVPADLEVPLDLNGDAEGGVESRWSHVITVEPEWEREEQSPEAGPGAPLRAEPFGIRPYFNGIGEAGPATPRDIGFRRSEVPTGRVTFTGG